VLAVIDKIFIGLVGNDNQVALDGKGSNLFGLSPSEHETAGILRRVVINCPRLRRRELLERVADPLRLAVAVGMRSGRDCVPVIKSAMGVQYGENTSASSPGSSTLWNAA